MGGEVGHARTFRRGAVLGVQLFSAFRKVGNRLLRIVFGQHGRAVRPGGLMARLQSLLVRRGQRFFKPGFPMAVRHIVGSISGTV